MPKLNLRRSYDLETTITLDGTDVDVGVDYRVTYSGSPGSGPSLAHPGDPPEAPEFEIDKIIANIDNNDVELNWDNLSKEAQEKLDEAIYEDIGERESDYYDD